MSKAFAKLRPQKVRRALDRRIFERALSNLVLDPALPCTEFGTPYGGWLIPDGVLGAEPVCYCVGSGDDISFDLDLIARCGATVRAVDPVPGYEPRVLAAAAGEPRFSFRRAALALRDGPIRMQAHHEPASQSLSAVGLYDTDDWTLVDGLTLGSLMAEWGDGKIELLKIDVEGLEYELVPSLDLGALGVAIFSVQLHHTGTVGQARELIEHVVGQGYRLVANRAIVKLSFVAEDRLPGSGT